MTSFERAWRGGRNDWRLHVLSVFSVAVAFVCLAAAVLVVVNVDGVRDAWARAGRASVFLKAGATPEQVSELEKALRATDGVRDVRHVSSDEARRELLKTSGDDLLEGLPAAAFPASLEVTFVAGASDERVDAIGGKLERLPAVESVETYQSWTTRLTSLLAGGVTAAVVLAAVVLAAVVSVVASTIRLTLQRRRREVEVLKLVGATDDYVRRPFVVEGAAQGALGALLAVGLLGVLYAIVSSSTDGALSTLAGVNPTFLPWYAILALVTSGGVLGAAAAWGSLRDLLAV